MSQREYVVSIHYFSKGKKVKSRKKICAVLVWVILFICVMFLNFDCLGFIYVNGKYKQKCMKLLKLYFLIDFMIKDIR